MRPRPMNPHTACTLCELEKHRLEVCLAVRGASRLKGEAIADTARISSGSFECELWIYADGQEDQVMPLVWLPGSSQFGSSRTEVVGGRWSSFAQEEEPLKAEANTMADGNHGVSNCRLIC